MIPDYNKVHLKFKLDKNHYSYNDLDEVAYSFVKEGRPFEQDIGNFLLDWLDKKDYILVNTSGSTGKPKRIKISKQAMVNSAVATGNYLNLKPGDTALYCLPAHYIAGKMMLVRAMILGLELDLTQPTSQPIFDYKLPYDFVAMVPLQLEKIYGYCDAIKTIIVGGAPVSNNLKKAIQGIKSNVYETYGMTETITHIALKKLNNFDGSSSVTSTHFKTLPNISLSQDKRNCLVINAPQLSEEPIITNDIVELHSETEFEWLGRFDNIINSGGIKFSPEQIEAKLQNSIKQRFFIASEKDERLGEQVILVVEGDSNTMADAAFSELEKFEKPKAIYNVSEFSETTSGKIQRNHILKQLKIQN
ncbi:AMP-binding protein [Hwangdonia lutea]|uniref:AMP-binding protein n=1 Tax=Hwangdonia lutea TaxID=3075823 RepID=A0AA97EKB0_9FLAO|nr:AMP-binding protein [Hwangdonia sp. SCSIO 19198]WOD43014.1 AMP-binding protein [Hwangdonia sp. SCSIO 19198]